MQATGICRGCNVILGKPPLTKIFRKYPSPRKSSTTQKYMQINCI